MRRWLLLSVSLPSRCGRGPARDEAQAASEHSGTDGGAVEELVRLRAGNARLLKAERNGRREILRRAAACFAREVK